MQSPGEALWSLSQVHSFVVPNSEEPFVRAILSPGEKLLGLYINHADDFILITDKSLHWIHGEVDRFIEYASLTTVNCPEDFDDLAVELTHADGDITYLPVINQTHEVYDRTLFYEFLTALLHFRHDDSIALIRGINTRDELARFLSESDDEELVYQSDIGDALRDGHPLTEELARLNIDPDLLIRPDVWRLIALVLRMKSSDRLQENLAAANLQTDSPQRLGC